MRAPSWSNSHTGCARAGTAYPQRDHSSRADEKDRECPETSPASRKNARWRWRRWHGEPAGLLLASPLADVVPLRRLDLQDCGHAPQAPSGSLNTAPPQGVSPAATPPARPRGRPRASPRSAELGSARPAPVPLVRCDGHRVRSAKTSWLSPRASRWARRFLPTTRRRSPTATASRLADRYLRVYVLISSISGCTSANTAFEQVPRGRWPNTLPLQPRTTGNPTT